MEGIKHPADKWNIILRHKYYQQQQIHKKQLRVDHIRQIFTLIEKQPHVYEIKRLRVWLDTCDREDLEMFIKQDYLQKLLNLLHGFEKLARKSKNYGIQLEILRIFELVVKNQLGLHALTMLQESATIILFNFTEFHSELNCLILTILVQLLWQSDLEFYVMVEAINKYKQEKFKDYRFQMFIDILKTNKNLILLENVIIFVLILV